MNSYALPPSAMNVINPTPTPSAYSSRSGNGEAPEGFARMLDQASAPPAAENPRPAQPPVEKDGPGPSTAERDAAAAADAGGKVKGKVQEAEKPAVDDGSTGDLNAPGHDKGKPRLTAGTGRAGVLPMRQALAPTAAHELSEALNRVDMAAAAAEALGDALTAAVSASDLATPAVSATLPDPAAPQPGVLPADVQPGWDAQALLGAWNARPQAQDAGAQDTRVSGSQESVSLEAAAAGQAAFGQIARSVGVTAGTPTAAVDTPAAATGLSAGSTSAQPVDRLPGSGDTLARAGTETASLTAAQAQPAGSQAKPGTLTLQAARTGAQPISEPAVGSAVTSRTERAGVEPLPGGAAQWAASSSDGAARNGAAAAAVVQAGPAPRRDAGVQAATAPGITSTAAGQDPIGERATLVAASDGAAAFGMAQAAGVNEDRSAAMRLPTQPDGRAALLAAQGSATQALAMSGSESGRGSIGESQGPALSAANGAGTPQAAALAWLTPAAGGVTPASAAVDGRIAASPGSPEFAPQLAAHVTTFVRDGLQHARLELNPGEMGPVTVQIQLDGNAARVHLAAENAQTRLALEQAMPQLAGSLRESGLTLSGGGVFEQPRQPQQQQAGSGGENRDNRDGSGRGTAASGQAALSAVSAPVARRQAGVVDLVA